MYSANLLTARPILIRQKATLFQSTQRLLSNSSKTTSSWLPTRRSFLCPSVGGKQIEISTSKRGFATCVHTSETSKQPDVRRVNRSITLSDVRSQTEQLGGETGNTSTVGSQGQSVEMTKSVHPGTNIDGKSSSVLTGGTVVEQTDTESIETADLLRSVEEALGSFDQTKTADLDEKPLVIVISGPSGVGKDAVIKQLQAERPELHFVVTATSRGMRQGEVDGVDYFFVTKEHFEEMIDQGELLEHAVVYGEYKGIPKQQVREALQTKTDVVLRVDVQGAAAMKRMMPEAVFIFLVAESEHALVQRLVSRKTETMDKLVVRVKTAREELQRLEEFDYVVVNKDRELHKSVALIGSIIDAEKARVDARKIVL
eukprot:CAMPEP_0197845544 /NCGR_PEP_ID=MMETSP1438-20131217/2464_1 /TAXON_ID=1461541 /ORGANISM="Pterosperma sp., Strain CCMP1384" /LENGTH=370 /DNA_ID=CAMNT_0043456883 /DNA_START=223 /DNA_END=1335 /DNA_ORIENTATION=-